MLLTLTGLGLLLAACGSQLAPNPVRPQSASTPTPPPQAVTAIPATATPPIVPPTPEATATEASLFAPVTDADWQTGPADARVTLIEYGDYQ